MWQHHCPGGDQEAAYSGFAPQLIWDIENCANVTEDTYNVTLGGKTLVRFPDPLSQWGT